MYFENYCHMSQGPISLTLFICISKAVAVESVLLTQLKGASFPEIYSIDQFPKLKNEMYLICNFMRLIDWFHKCIFPLKMMIIRDFYKK